MTRASWMSLCVWPMSVTVAKLPSGSLLLSPPAVATSPPLLRRVVFVSEAALGAGFDFEGVRLGD